VQRDFSWLASKSRWKVDGQELKLGTDVIWVSSQWFVGDDANQNPKLSDYWVANLHGSYQLTKELQIYGFVNDLFNRKFATFGTFFDPQSTVARWCPEFFALWVG
jgi:outer membrane receptor protein involved in Fe transport